MVDSITGVLSLKSRITMKEHRLMKATRQTFPAPAATRTKKMKVRQTTRSGQRHANLRRGLSTGVELVGGRSSSPPPRQKRKKEDSPNCSSSVFVCSALSASWIIFWSCFSWSSPKKLRAAPPPRRGPRLAAETHSAPRHPGSSIVALLHAAAPLPWPCACTMVAHLLVPQSLAVRPPTPPTERTAPMPTMLALVSVARRPPAPDPLCVAPRAAMVVGKVTSLSEKENRRSRVATGPAGGQQGSRP